MAWYKSFFFLLTGIALAVLSHALWGGYWGVGTVTVFVFIYLYFDYQRYHATLKWANATDNAPPPYVGRYDGLVNPLYKTLRIKSNDILNLNHLNHSILTAAQALPAAAITLDENFTVEWCNHNAKSLLGIDYTKDRGYNLFNIIRIPDLYDYVHQGDWSKPFLNTIETDGQTLHLKFELTQYAEDRILLLCIDNTQLEKLRTTQQDFVANVSHEIRTPLTVLIGFLETIRDLPPEALSPEQREYYQNLMHEQANRMLAIVADLLTLSTLESTKLANGEAINGAGVIEQIKLSAQALSQNQHTITWDLDPDIIIQGNANELLSAFTNLITNAIRYTPSGGQINIIWSRNADGAAVFSVSDTGLGIAARDISRITERFYRVDKSRSRASGGTGLGLAITKHIAIRHHAKLKIESKLNKGSTFSIVFPSEFTITENDYSFKNEHSAGGR